VRRLFSMPIIRRCLGKCLAFACAGLVSWGPLVASGVLAEESAIIRIVTLGDSITRGVRSGVEADETFAALLAAQLTAQEVRADVTNVGIGGERTDQALARLEKDVLSLKPRLVVIMYGTNDSYVDKGRTQPRLTVDEYRANLTALVKRVRAAAGEPILMTPPRWGDKAADGAGENPNRQLEPYVEACRAAASAARVPLVDNYAQWSREHASGLNISQWMTDECHPNPQGHEVIAKSLLPVVLAALARPAGAQAADWPAFRGPLGNGVSDQRGVPQTWGPDKNIRWKASLPGPGNSSPVVSSDRVFVTCATERGKQRGLYCFDRRNGKQLWAQVVTFDADDPTHETNPYCGSSPAADGERVVVWHGSAGLHAYDYEGRPLWSRDLGTFRHIWGYGSSPVFHGDAILLNCGPGKRTFVTAIDRHDGHTLWQVDEPDGDDGDERPGEKPKWLGSWSTPVIEKVDGRDQVLVSLPHYVNAYDPNDGKIVWSCDGLGDLAYTSVLTSDGFGVAMCGYFGPAMGFRLGGRGNTTETNRRWLTTEPNPQRIGSGVIVGRHIFMANEPGLAQCLELESGDEVWRERLSGVKIWASLVLAEGRLYVTDQDGVTYLFAPNPEKFELLGKNEIGESTNSTLALSGGQAFLRTFEHLFCIEEMKPE